MRLLKNTNSYTDGFTLLEVALFLAISGGMAVIALAGLGPRLRNLRFTQSVRGTESSINNEFSASLAGKNQGLQSYSCSVVTDGWGTNASISKGMTNKPGTSAKCVINGRLAIFEADKVTFYSIYSVADAIGTCQTPATFNTLSACYRPRVARGYFNYAGNGFDEPPYPVIYRYPNGVTATSSLNGDGKVLAFGYIQDPNGTQAYRFFHRDGENADWNKQLLSDADTAVTEDTSKADSISSPSVCLKLGTRTAKLSFSVNSVKPKVEFVPCT